MSGTAKDLCQAQLLEERAKRLGFVLGGGWAWIEISAGPKLRKQYGLVDGATMCRTDTIEGALLWLSGWTDRDMYESMRRGR